MFRHWYPLYLEKTGKVNGKIRIFVDDIRAAQRLADDPGKPMVRPLQLDRDVCTGGGWHILKSIRTNKKLER